MPAYVKTQTGSKTYASCDPQCEDVISFLHELLDSPPYAPASLRLEAFEDVHLLRCERCKKFSATFVAFIERGKEEMSNSVGKF